ncbi:hypothetical protein B0A49_03098 [Cryomyces minteri]|uniref:Uncharacterized protein n=1 Tax=Cryomyces minteri TaxID=331657 RepID=A0A4U0XJ85_9PEZI|nr:hypothetical protein B0A49_03098 [Cryomyces minteri]
MAGNPPGSYRLVRIAQDSWPVIVCDRSMLPEDFQRSEPNGYVVAVMLLHTLELLWIAPGDLLEFDPCDIASLQESLNATNPLHEAYKELLYFEELDYWKQLLQGKALANELVKEAAKMQDDGDGGVPLGDNAATKIGTLFKKTDSLSAGPSEAERNLERGFWQNRDVDAEHDGEPKWGLETNPPDLATEPITDPTSGVKSERSEEALETELEIVSILIGKPYRIFQVVKARIERHPELFEPVADWLNHGEYHPFLVDDGTPFVHLQGLILRLQKADEVLRCGLTFAIAGQVELAELQELAVRKLRALHPYAPLQILQTAQVVFKAACGPHRADAAMRALLEDHLVDAFYDLMRDEPGSLHMVMTEHAALAERVHARLAVAAGEAKAREQQAVVEDEDEEAA